MMVNGERCPFHDNTERVLAEGDEIYLLARWPAADLKTSVRH